MCVCISGLRCVCIRACSVCGIYVVCGACGVCGVRTYRCVCCACAQMYGNDASGAGPCSLVGQESVVLKWEGSCSFKSPELSSGLSWLLSPVDFVVRRAC